MADDNQNRISDYSCYLSKTAKRRRPIAFPDFVDDCIFMSSGFPNPSSFPIAKGQITLKDGTTLQINEEEMISTLQYCHSTRGNRVLINWLTDFQKHLHNPPTLDHSNKPSSMDVLVTSGATEGFGMILETLLQEGDTLLLEEFTYPGVLNLVDAHGFNGMHLKLDEKGIVPSSMEVVLSNWNEAVQGRRPSVLYCVPTAANPTGITWALSRKQEIYDIARKYNILIVEDDPYYLLQFSKPLVPSFLTLDVDGRVIRVDSFSKLMSAGGRLGYMSGPKDLLDKVELCIVTSTVHASNISQTFTLKVLQHFGIEGFLQHASNVCGFYKKRNTQIMELLDTHLTGLAEWTFPMGGMFVWLRLLGIEDSNIIHEKTTERGAMFVSGCVFCASKEPSKHIRLSFSLTPEEDFSKALKILADVVREEQHT